MESSKFIVWFKKRGWIILVVIVLIAAAASPSIYYYKKYQESQDLLLRSLTDPQSSSKIQVNELLSKVSKLVELPNDEIPEIVTITDISKVQNQPFFKDSKNGDVILVYRNARKAVIYDPVFNKIIRVGPLIFPTPTVGLGIPTASSSPTLNKNQK